MKVALLQMRLEAGKRSANLTNAVQWIDQAADLEPAPDLICLPAACDYGPNPNKLAAPMDSYGGSFAETIALKARDLGLFIALGHADVDHHHAYRAVSLFDPDGDPVLRYRGVVVPRPGRANLAGGTTLAVRETMLGRIGLLVDTDLGATCLPGALAAMGATLMVVAGSGGALSGGPRTVRQLGEIARTCGAHLLVTQPSSADDRGECVSAAISPAGRCLASGPPGEESIVSADIPITSEARRGKARAARCQQ